MAPAAFVHSRPPTSVWGQPISGHDTQVHARRQEEYLRTFRLMTSLRAMPHLPLTTFFGRTTGATDVHPSLASRAVRATAPDATDSASNLGTISRATAPVAPQVVLPAVPPLHFGYALVLGPGAQSLSGPCATVPNRLSAGPMATLTAVLRRSTGSRRGRLQNG